MSEIASDPFGEKTPKPYFRRSRILGADVLFRSNDPGMLDLVDAAFAGLPRHGPESDAVKLRIDLLRTAYGEGAADARPPELRFFSGAEFIVATLDGSNFAAISVPGRSALISIGASMLAHPYTLRYELIEFTVYTLVSRNLNLLPLHAACVGRGQSGVLLNGRSGTGKSVLSLACMLRGLEFISDDAVFVSPDTLLATGCSNYLHISEDSLQFVGDTSLRESLHDAPRIERRSGASKLAIDARRKPFTPARQSLRIRALILLSPVRTDRANLLTEMPSSVALSALASDQAYAVSLPQWARFCAEIAEIPAFELKRADHPEQAAAVLADLLTAFEQ
jgi:hypothetical protein